MKYQICFGEIETGLYVDYMYNKILIDSLVSQLETQRRLYYEGKPLWLKPVTDIRENIHGEWVKNNNGTYSCSLCQSWIPNEQHSYARFCLHCGADMRGKING